MPAFMGLRDVGLFLRSARTDARIKQLRCTLSLSEALEIVYTTNPDPWASAAPRYRYQRRKYEVLLSLLPPRHFNHALDLGCGLGFLSRLLSTRANAVLGVDVAPSAVARARALHSDQPTVRFETHDLLDLPRCLDGQFDLVTVADVLYYLMPLDRSLLQSIARRIGSLLTSTGVCLLANHYFFGADPESRRSRRIHDVFIASPTFTARAEYRRPFYLATVLQAQASA